MKNRLATGGRPAKKPKPPKGRYARVWLSPEFVAWCQRHHFKPAGGANCITHTYALQHPGTYTYTVKSEGSDHDDLYDLPNQGGATP